jgi:hypothetical protein
VSAGTGQGSEQGSRRSDPNTTDAASGVELQAYRAAKRSMVAGSLIVAVPLSLLVAVGSRAAAVAFATGILCGIVNALLTMRSSERLVDHRSVSIFVLSSVLRILMFGILPVGLALHGPWWSLASYFAGFFTPLALFAASVGRAPRTNQQ